MIKTSVWLLGAWSGAWALREHTVYLDYYYAVMVLVGFVYGVCTRSFAYAGLTLLMTMLYALENNAQIWHESIYVLATAYFFAAAVILIFQADDGLNLGLIIAGLMVLKCVSVVALEDHMYLMHTILNFLSIAQWVIFTRIAATRIQLNRGYSAKDNPFMLRVRAVLTWSQGIKNRLLTYSSTTQAK